MVAYHSKCPSDPTHKSLASPLVTEWFSQTDHWFEDDKLSSFLTEYLVLFAATARTLM